MNDPSKKSDGIRSDDALLLQLLQVLMGSSYYFTIFNLGYIFLFCFNLNIITPLFFIFIKLELNGQRATTVRHGSQVTCKI